MVNAASLAIERTGDWLTVRFSEPQRSASWAIVGGGVRCASGVAWLQIHERDLEPPVDPSQFLAARMEAAGLSGAVGLLTSSNLDRFVDTVARSSEVSARCVATVGLSNALRAGDPPGVGPRVGTINLLCQVSAGLTGEALLEALAIAAEARTVAVLESGVSSRISGKPASGTGTDCIVIAAPDGQGEPLPYAGKHTAAGHVIGSAVYEAVRLGVERWLR